MPLTKFTMSDLDALMSADGARVSGKIFSDQEIYEIEREAIFKKCWQFVGCENQIGEAGHFIRSRLGEQDVIVARAEDMQIHVSANICRHRGNTLCRADQGKAKRFTCTYHGWSFGLDGELKGIPMERQLEWDIDKSKLGLLKAKVETFHGLIFATFDPDAEPLRDFIGEAAFYLDTMLQRRKAKMVVIGGPHKWDLEANWKSPAENMTGDFYHVTNSHASVLKIYPGLGDSIKLMTDQAHASFVSTEQGHALNTFVMPKGLPPEAYLPIEPRWLEKPSIHKYFSEIQPEAEEQLGELRSRLRLNTCTIFPNLSVLPGAFCLRLTLPKGPHESESWCWVMGYDDMPAEVRDTAHAAYLDVFGPDGILEPDDAENWANVVEGLSGPMAKDMDLYAGLGMGTETTDPDMPGIHAHPLSESGHRAFYLRWREQIAASIENKETGAAS